MEKIKSQGEWLNIIKTGACNSCHGARHAGNADDLAGARPVPVLHRGMDAPPDVGRRADVHDPRHHAPRYAAGDRDVRRLDRPRRRRRASLRQAGAAARHRAQRGGEPVGLGQPHHLSARRGLHRPPQPARQRQRQDLRHGGGQPGRHSGARSGDAHGERAATSGPRSEHAVVQGQRDGAVAILGRRSDLGQQDAQPQSDARREGTRVVHAAHPPGGQSRLLQAGILAPVGADRADRNRRPESVVLRSGDRQVHADRYLLRHPSPQLRARMPTRRCGPAPGSAARA